MITIRTVRNVAGYASNHLQYSDYLDEDRLATSPPKVCGAEQRNISGPAEVLDRLTRERQQQDAETDGGKC